MNSPGQQVPNKLLEISGQMTPDSMKRQSQSKNNTQLWMGLVIEERPDAVKSNIAQEPRMLGASIKQIGSGQTGDDKSKRQHFGNQQTKMDWNG